MVRLELVDLRGERAGGGSLMAGANPYSPPETTEELPAEGAFEEVFRSNDPVLMQAIEDLLDAYDIDVRSSGQLSGAAVGVGQHLVANILRVPVDEAERARKLVQDFLDSTPVTDEEDEEEHEVPDQRRLIVAGLVPFVIPFIAGGLFYARRRVAATILTVAECLAFFAFNGMGVYAVLKVTEAVLAVRAARAWNRGERSSALREALGVAIAILIALVIGAALSGGMPRFRGIRAV